MRIRQDNAGRTGAVLAMLAAGGLLAGCSSMGGGSAFSMDRFTSLFGSSSGGSTAPAADAANPPLAEVDCPTVEIRPGAASLAVSQPTRGGEPDINALRYQLSFVETARQCRVAAGMMTIKVGVQGRIVLGPSGGPGAVPVPLRYAVVQEGPEPKPIVSKFVQHSASIEPGQANALFTAITDDITFPVPPGAAIDAYVIYVGFDAQGARNTPAKATPKRRR